MRDKKCFKIITYASDTTTWCQNDLSELRYVNKTWKDVNIAVMKQVGQNKTVVDREISVEMALILNIIFRVASNY